MYLLFAGVVSGSLDGGQTDGDGKFGVLSTISHDGANLSSHNAQVTESLESGDDFDFIFSVSSAPVAQNFAQFGRKLENFGAGLTLLGIFAAVATSKASQTKKSNG